MATRKTFTEETIKRLKPPRLGRVDYYERTTPGLCLRVSHTGRKSWTLLYWVNGKQKRMSLGRYPALGLADVREKARLGSEQALAGIDPREALEEAARADAQAKARAIAEAEGKTGLLFENVADRFIDEHAKVHNKTWAETNRVLNTHVTPLLKGKVLPDITKAEVREMLAKASAQRTVKGKKLGGPGAANAALAATRKLFNWAIDDADLYPGPSPCKGVKAPTKILERERELTDDETKAVWAAADAMGPPLGSLYQFLLVTGQRRGEAANAKWSEIDFDAKEWRIDRSRMKSGRTHIVPLSPLALHVLRGLPRRGADKFVFSTTEGKRPVSGFSKAKRNLDKKAEFDDWRIHDLRRTCATGMGRLGTVPYVVSKALGHAEGGVTKIYLRHNYLPEIRTALDAWSDHLQKLVGLKDVVLIDAS